MKPFRFISGLIPLLIFLQACAPAYVPNAVPSPGLHEKGDLALSAHYGNSGFDLQGAYGISNHLGVMINGSYNNRTLDTANYHKHGFLEAGLGYFSTEGEHMNWSVFGGFGGGNYQSYFESNIITNYNFVNINRFFIQPSAGFYSNYFESDLAFRLAFLSIKGYRDGINNNPERYEGFYTMLEPALTLKFGPEHFKFFFQGGMSFNLENSEYLDHNPFIMSLGIQVRFNPGMKRQAMQ